VTAWKNDRQGCDFDGDGNVYEEVKLIASDEIDCAQKIPPIFSLEDSLVSQRRKET
jgi:hypothetical protein